MPLTAAKRAQIIAALQAASLDRVRLMKTLFLFWHRAGRPNPPLFDFRPYLYGPCAFDVYGALEEMEARGLIVQAPQEVTRWAPYHLTAASRQQLAAAGLPLMEEDRKKIAEIARWASKQDFRGLLNQVYDEAPDFAAQSVLRSGRSSQ